MKRVTINVSNRESYDIPVSKAIKKIKVDKFNSLTCCHVKCSRTASIWSGQIFVKALHTHVIAGWCSKHTNSEHSLRRHCHIEGCVGKAQLIKGNK